MCRESPHSTATCSPSRSSSIERASRTRHQGDDVDLADGHARLWARAATRRIGSSGQTTYQAIDLTDPAVAETFEERLPRALSSGVDGLKVDRGDEVDLELRSLAGGSGDEVHNTIRSASRSRSARAVTTGAWQDRSDDVPGGLHRVAASRDGCVVRRSPGEWDGLENAIRSAQTAGIVGYSTWGSDVGGYQQRIADGRHLRPLDPTRCHFADLRGRGRRPERSTVGARIAAMAGL